MGNSWNYRYDTGWINCSDWSNRHLGSNTTLNTDSNVNHKLNAPLSDLLVKVFISTDGTDANSFEVGHANYSDIVSGTIEMGFTVYQIDNNNIRVQTGSQGIDSVGDAAGTGAFIDTENYYYKVKVWYIG